MQPAYDNHSVTPLKDNELTLNFRHLDCSPQHNLTCVVMDSLFIAICLSIEGAPSFIPFVFFSVSKLSLLIFCYSQPSLYLFTCKLTQIDQRSIYFLSDSNLKQIEHYDMGSSTEVSIVKVYQRLTRNQNSCQGRENWRCSVTGNTRVVYRDPRVTMRQGKEAW